MYLRQIRRLLFLVQLQIIVIDYLATGIRLFALGDNVKLSKRVCELNFSATIKLADKVRELESKGEKIIQLGAGQPHIPTPSDFKMATIKALYENQVYYSHSQGIPELRELITQRYNNAYETALNFEKNVLITPGAKQAILYFAMALIDPHDEIIIPTPSWVSYGDIVKLAGGQPVIVECDRSKKFELSVDLIEKAITPKTKAIILNSPNNPTGTIIKKSTLKAIYKLCLKYDIYLLCDEIYESIVFDKQENTSIMSLSLDLKNCVLINGFSKIYSMTGWRLGYVLAQEEIINAMLKLQQNSISCPTTFAQFGAIEALKNGDWFTSKLVQIYQENRDFLVNGLKELKVFDFICPDGAFYMFIDVSKINKNSTEFCLDLLERCKIAVVPGVAFGRNGEGFIRISFATSKENIAIFLQRLKENYVIGLGEIKK